MKHVRFTLADVLIALTVASFCAWCLPPDSIWPFVVSINACGAIAAARFRSSRPYFASAVAGFGYVLLCVALWWPIFLLGYLRHDGSHPYFEDGFFVEAFWYPVIICLLYSPIAGLMSFFTGVVTHKALWLAGNG